MKATLIWIFLFVTVVGNPWFSHAGDFTEKDRERLIRLETKVEEEGDRYQRALREYARIEPRLAEILRGLNLP